MQSNAEIYIRAPAKSLKNRAHLALRRACLRWRRWRLARAQAARHPSAPRIRRLARAKQRAAARLFGAQGRL